MKAFCYPQTKRVEPAYTAEDGLDPKHSLAFVIISPWEAAKFQVLIPDLMLPLPCWPWADRRTPPSLLPY